MGKESFLYCPVCCKACLVGDKNSEVGGKKSQKKDERTVVSFEKIHGGLGTS